MLYRPLLSLQTTVQTSVRTAGLTALFAILASSGCGHLSERALSGQGGKSEVAAEPGRLLVIAHRGASGYRPEHTLASYQLAIDQGADFIEPDLVPTKDGALIARHENALALVALNDNGAIKRTDSGQPEVLSATTDVAERPEFAHLLKLRTIDGRAFAGWFSEDFTLSEIKTLYARERIPKLRPSNSSYKRLRIPSLEEILDLLKRGENAHIGMYPELKHPTHFRYGTRSVGGPAINIDTAALLAQTLATRQFTNSERLYIQCFEVETLRRLKHSLLPQAGFSAPLVQLTGLASWSLPDVQFHLQSSELLGSRETYLQKIYGPLAQPLAADPSYKTLMRELTLVAQDYAKGIGPRKADAKSIAPTARALGMQLHPYTVRAEPFFLQQSHGGLADTVEAELEQLRAIGATGVFIDQPDLAVRWQSSAKN